MADVETVSRVGIIFRRHALAAEHRKSLKEAKRFHELNAMVHAIHPALERLRVIQPFVAAKRRRKLA